MRQFFSIARATALEMASEPLALLLTLSAMALAVLAPIMHYHQFGEASRMARDAGLSASLVFGIAYAVFCTVKSVRREIDSGTLEMALAHPVSRAGFFLAKLTGAALAYLVFAVTVTAVSVTTVNGAEIGGRIAAKVGDVATVFGPSRVCAISAIVVPTVLGAVLNRFARFRFTLTATVLALAISLVGMIPYIDGSLVWRFLPVAAVLTLPAFVFISASAAFAVKWHENAATSAAGVLFLVSVPLLGNYYLSDILSKGGSLPLRHLGISFAATIPMVAAFVMLGVHLFEGRDVDRT